MSQDRNTEKTSHTENTDKMIFVRFFHEIALKGGNRSSFVSQLSKNLTNALSGTGIRLVLKRPMGALLVLEADSDSDLIINRLENLIGIEYFSWVWRVDPQIDCLKEGVVKLISDKPAQSFRITSRRSDKTFPLSSPQINQEIGAFVRKVTSLTVDLDHPDINVLIDISKNEALITLDQIQGLKGMPVGIGGHTAALLSGGIDSPVAAFHMMRRGCHVLFIHFHSFPMLEGTSREKALELVEILTRYQFNSTLLLVPFSDVQQRIILSVPPAYRVVVYRRFMFRIAEKLALRHGARALITGESLGQVSSQTLENLTTIETVRQELMILRPLISMHKQEIVSDARKLGTYEVSIIPDQDCCSLFVPKHPVIRSQPDQVEQLEAELPIDTLVDRAVHATEQRIFHWPG